MSNLRPVAVYGLEIPCNGVAIEANPEDLPANFRITMAAIDPTEEAVVDDDAAAGPPRATLKLIRIPFGAYDDEDESGSEEEDVDDDDVAAIERRLGMTSEDDESSDEENGGPGEKTKQARTAALLAALRKEEEEEKENGLTNGVNGVKSNKGKEKASDESGSDYDSDDEDLDIDEYVICTLDANQHYQQALDITVNEGEQVYFKVIGAHNVHLTGNYFVPDDEIEQSDDDEDSEDDELENALAGYDVEGMSDEEDYSEEDELDNLKDPRVMEIDSEDEAPKLITAKPTKKGKNKRTAEEDESEEEVTKDILAKILKAEEPVNGEAEPKLSKKQKKKLKNNAGEATEAPKVEEKPASKKDAKKDAKKEVAAAKDSSSVNGSGKKVQFADKLEQGPTPTKSEKAQKKGPRNVGGVTVDDRKPGSGPAAKKGDKIAMRYIGKLKDGKIFDSNTKGQAFSFKLGVGEVIKGWDVGVLGMTAGSERRLTIPANLAYGKQGTKGIPGNSELIFDVKLLSIN